MSDIDSDDDFIKCYECEEEIDVSKLCIYKKSKVCKNCKELCEENDITQPDIVMRKRASNRAPSGFVKPTRISDKLASFLGKDKGIEMARTGVTREINLYIRSNNLQDKENGRKINPDTKLQALLKLETTDELTYFNLQKYLSPHFAKKLCEENDIAQPVRMIYTSYQKLSFSCCGRDNCIQIKCIGNVQGHEHLYSCDPELTDYPGLLSKIKINMHCSTETEYLNGKIIYTFISVPFEETTLLRRLRLQKTERLNLIKEKINNEKMKVKIQIEKDAKEIALRYKSLQNEKDENAQKLREEKNVARLQQKEKWEKLSIGTKIVELESELCYKLHGNLPYIYEPGARLSLYEDNRFKTLQKTCSVIEQAHESYRTKNFEAKDQIEKILEILEKWLKEIDPNKYLEIKGFPRMPPPPPFDWTRFNPTSK